MTSTVSLCLALGLMYGCTQTSQYTSKDLTILPCEQKANEFFYPLEFDEAGNYVYEDQAPAIEKALLQTQRVFVFVHGWDKSPKLAEGDYQDLICRFYTHSKHDSDNAKKSIIIGVFWPSADFPPLLNFWRMKNRADGLAVTGFQNLMNILANPAIEPGGDQDLVLIGHSFGGRIILSGLTHYIAQLTPERYRFLHNLNQLQLILLTTAMGEYRLMPLQGFAENPLALEREWDSEAFLKEMVKQYGRQFTHNEWLVDVPQIRLQWHPTLVQLSGLTDLRIFNIFSTHDGANRFLYPLGSFAEHGGSTCAIGACGVSQWPKLVSVTSAGSLETALDLAQSSVWNVDASKVIFAHTDIYKGRIANLVWELISLPRPQYAEIELPKDFLLSSGKSNYYLGDGDWYKYLAYENLRAMKEINRFRQMGDAGLKLVNELRLLAFSADEELKKGDWAAAEQKLREISKLPYFYPGWSAQFSIGLVHKGIFVNSTGVHTEWQPLTQNSIHKLLMQVLVKQNKCDEAIQEREWLRNSSPSLFQYDEQEFHKALGSDKVRSINCREE
ncbi:MAG: hypothetical protein CAF45_013155 [Nitrospira sp. CG24E]|nr:MAG: hypothetical protein CAF45_013155 [Nitrospira sp. CG24E]